MRAFLARNRFLLLFALLSSLMGISVGVAKVTTSLYAHDLGASAGLLGLIAGSQSLGVLVMSLPIGFLVDQVGPGRLFLLGSLLAGSVYLVLPSIPTPLFLLTCTTAISFFMPMRFVSLNTVFMRQIEVLGEGKAGWYRGTHMIGMFLIGPAMAVAVVRLVDFSGAYRLVGLAFGLSILLGPSVFGPHARALPSQGHRALGWRDIPSELALLATDRSLREVAIVDFFAQAANMYFSFFIVVIALDVLHLDGQAASGLIATHGGAFTVALFALGRLVARFGAGRIQIAGFFVIAAGLTLLGLGQRLEVLHLGALALGLGLGLLQIVNLTRYARIGARLGRGKIAGITALVGPSGGFFGSVVGGMAGRAFGLQTVFLLLVPVFLLLARSLLGKPAAIALESR